MNKRVTCYCSAYPFPHRLLGGSCTQATAASYYAAWLGGMCSGCSRLERCHGQSFCTVMSEDTSLPCPAVEFALSTGALPK